MSNKKLFESDISATLKALGGYYYKPPDILQAGQDKVDFLFCYKGHYVAIEAKEVPGLSCPPSAFSPGQKLALIRVARSGGLPVVVVNYGRRKDKTGRGRAAAFIIGTVGVANALRFDLMGPWPAAEHLSPMKGSTWSLGETLDRWLAL